MVVDVKKKIIISALVALFVIGASLLFYGNRVVAVAYGNKILYNNTIYEESYENFDFEIGTYLGRVDFDFGTPFSAKCRLYTLIEKPEYLFVDMGLIDWRIYKQSSY